MSFWTIYLISFFVCVIVGALTLGVTARLEDERECFVVKDLIILALIGLIPGVNLLAAAACVLASIIFVIRYINRRCKHDKEGPYKRLHDFLNKELF